MGKSFKLNFAGECIVSLLALLRSIYTAVLVIKVMAIASPLVIIFTLRNPLFFIFLNQRVDYFWSHVCFPASIYQGLVQITICIVVFYKYQIPGKT